MNERAEAFEDEYRRLIAQVPLPDALKDTYDICDCLRETSDKATYRIRSRSDGRFYLLKIAADGRENLASEHELLCALSHPARMQNSCRPAPAPFPGRRPRPLT